MGHPAACLGPFLSSSEGLGILQKGSWVQERPGAEGPGQALTWVPGWPSGHKEEVGTPWARCLLSRWPSPWRWLMITLLLVNTDHKCGSKGMKPWTVPRPGGGGGAFLGSIRLGPHLSLLVASEPSHPQPVFLHSPPPLFGLPPQVTMGSQPSPPGENFYPVRLVPRHKGTAKTQRG